MNNSEIVFAATTLRYIYTGLGKYRPTAYTPNNLLDVDGNLFRHMYVYNAGGSNLVASKMTFTQVLISPT